MKACPTTFAHPSEAQILNGLGPKLCDRLTDKLKKYNADHGLPMPEKPHKAAKDKRPAPDISEEPGNAIKKRRPQMYVPKQRSGPYALILALASLDPESDRALSKSELIELAQPHCDASFTVGSDTTKHFTAWNSMKTLESKELVCTKGHPTKRYYLSDEGWDVALACKKILEGDGAGPSKQRKYKIIPPSKEPTKPDAVKQTRPSTVRSAEPLDITDLSSEPDISTEGSRQPQHPRLQVPGNISLTFDEDTIILPHNSFDIKLVLDTREVRSKTDRDYISEELRKQGVHPISRSLPLGDIVWVAKVRPEFADQLQAMTRDDQEEHSTEIVLDYIVERKRLDDLISSIKDGRFHEQKFRLRKSGVQNITYLVEAFSISAERSELYAQSVETAITSTQVVNDIFVKQTLKLDDTIRYLARMTRTLEDLYEKKEIRVVRSDRIVADKYLSLMSSLRAQHASSTLGLTLSAFEALCDKSQAMTLRDVYLKMLLCIRGVTADKAVEIQKLWPTPIALLEAYERCTTALERDTMISNRLANAIPRKKVAKTLSTKVAASWYGDSA
jgi:crossover junction endonuclease MUS81